jgi:hypothetical protein
MRRATLVPFLVCAVVAVAAPRVAAATLPSGTITCQIDANTDLGLRMVPYIDSTPGGRIMMKDKIVGTCDSSGVTGGKGPIERFEATLVAKLAAGTVCTDLVTAPDFDKVKLGFKWKGHVGDRDDLILATSRVHLVLGSWDDPDQALVFTGEIFKGAFSGSTTTMKLTLHEPGLAYLNPTCPPIVGVFYGTDGESELTVP